MRWVLSLVWLLLVYSLQAQYKVTFHIVQLPPYHAPGSGIYIAGPFNNWNPGNTDYQLHENNITLQMPKGSLEYKFTRGSWAQAESSESGASVENRKAEINSDTTIDISIAGWADHFEQQAQKSTASKNVHIVDTAFYIPQLNRYRRIWIYLPEGYETSRKRYPVLYMQDGQNVFDAATSFSGEWGVDEALDTLGKQYGQTIVVAIDNGGDKRLNEYSPHDMPKYGKGEGDQYVAFLVHTLKPYIDRYYRTYKGRKHTSIAGSSMGGLISFYALLKYPKVFGAAGVFSPAFWVAPAIKNDIEKMGKKVKGKIYFYAGQQEGETMVPDMLAIFEQMHRISKADMVTVIRAGGKHNEASWRNEFPLFYKWINPHPLKGSL